MEIIINNPDLFGVYISLGLCVLAIVTLTYAVIATNRSNSIKRYIDDLERKSKWFDKLYPSGFDENGFPIHPQKRDQPEMKE